MKNLNDEKQQKFPKTSKSNLSRVYSVESVSLSEDWEFENYTKERLKALGIIQ